VESVQKTARIPNTLANAGTPRRRTLGVSLSMGSMVSSRANDEGSLEDETEVVWRIALVVECSGRTFVVSRLHI
jgi:hypothetical protein